MSIEQRLFEIELEFERRIHESRTLSLFRRNPSTWELLMYLASHEGGSDAGIYKTLDQLVTRYLGDSAMLKFVRQRRDDGLFVFSEHEKRSMRRVEIAPELREELLGVVEARNAAIAGLLRDPGAGGGSP